MAIEEALAALTAAINENTKRLDKMLGGATTGGGTKPAGTTAAGTKPAGTKPAGTKPKAEEISAETMGKRGQDYVKGQDDKEAALANLTRINEVTGAARFSATAPDKRAEALALLDRLEAGEDPDDIFGAAEGSEEEYPV